MQRRLEEKAQEEVSAKEIKEKIRKQFDIVWLPELTKYYRWDAERSDR